MRETSEQPLPARNAAHTRSAQRAEWQAVAPRWRVPDLTLDPPPIHSELIAMAEVRARECVLDLACGTGCAALMRRLAPGGTLLGLDLSPEMVEIAAQWASRQQLPWVTFRAISSETDLGVKPGSFDVATCLFGLMYMPEPLAALRALYEALRPGGRVALCTWSSPEHCPFLGVPLAVARRHVQHAMLDLSGPHPFAIPSTGALSDLLASAGFTAVRTATMQRPVESLSPEQYWEYMLATGWPLAFLPPQARATRQAMHDDMVATLDAMFPDRLVRLSGEANLAVASRPW